MIVALGLLDAHQTQATKNIHLRALRLLNYATSHPDSTIRYLASNMVLHIHSNASYLSEPKARIRAGSYYFLGNCYPVSHQPPSGKYAIIGPIFTISKILSNVMASAAKAEIGATVLNGQESIPICATLVKLRHAQSPTPLCVDNSTATGFANYAIKTIQIH